MFAHLASTWILSRILLGFAASAIAAIGAFGALTILRAYRAEGPSDERTLLLERRSELVSTALQLALGLQLAAALMTVVVSDRLAPSIRGAMCAFGVVGSNVWGARALGTSLVAASVCVAWLTTYRVDTRLRRGSLVRTLSWGALAATCAVFADAIASANYLLRLDLGVVATCCTVFVDAAHGSATDLADGHGRLREIGMAAVATVAGIVASIALARRASAGRGLLAGAIGLVGAALSLRAVVDVVAPYAYERPSHRCAYCLLRGEGGAAGVLLLVGLAIAFLCGVAALAVVPLLRREGARNATLSVLSKLGRTSALAWILVAVAGAWPILHYRVVSGTFDLFR